jgi:hypothetical protein
LGVRRYVAYEFVMGLDVLKAYGAFVDLGHRMLQLGEEVEPLCRLGCGHVHPYV